MRVTILGCGGSGGVPLLGGADARGAWGACDPSEPRNRRMRSSIAIQAPDGTTLLVDAGPDLRAQLLAHGIGRVDAVLLTHSHADHVMGLDELRIMNRIMGRALPLYANAATLEDVTRRFDYAFRPVTPGFFRPALEQHEVRAGQRVNIAGFDIRLFSQDHRVMETLGLRIGGFGYSTDVVEMPEPSFAELDGVRDWVVGCFQRQPHPVHAHVAKVVDWARRLQPARTVLTHMGPDLDWAWMRGALPHGMEPGFDGMVLETA
ncbi:MBL fold metallo-hydrolase [Roseomonas sp. SSH11]|uniref:MBL fold metallo-hydrolase n=1 Tax=Pararoseomonas baculiformis TaxID=2820812 RepID=A0ABS4AA57_9PROT|nr:MBL fold metallo-hydrolase [Pararoseomonas baculiformis]MBP0443878.1 MBL fold metallo-hydrolase [Pararoseomonas baculiformis]